MSLLEQQRHLFQKKRNKKDLQFKQNETMSKLNMFTNQIKDQKDESSGSWLNHKLKFHIDSINAYEVTKEELLGFETYRN